MTRNFIKGRGSHGFEFFNSGRGTYSVMQSDGNSFCEDVVLDSFNKASKDEDDILEQISKKQICLDFL